VTFAEILGDDKNWFSKFRRLDGAILKDIYIWSTSRLTSGARKVNVPIFGTETDLPIWRLDAI
jgi:hypothetical protein